MDNIALQNIANIGRTIYLFTRESNGSQKILKDDTFYPFYYEISKDEDSSIRSYDNRSLKKIIVSHPKEVTETRSARSYSSDIRYTTNYLIHRIESIALVQPKYAFLDIEVLAPELPEEATAIYPISCVSIYNSQSKEVKTWYIDEMEGFDLEEKEQHLHSNLINYLKQECFDIICIWNAGFDFSYLCNRIKDFAKSISPINAIRAGEEKDIPYPAGISVIDYLRWFKKVSMREQSYALDNIAQKHLGEKTWAKTDFGKLNPLIKEKNINDVLRMQKLEEIFHIIPYFNEIRVLSKCQYEDQYHNSRIIESLLLEEAKKQNIVLPNKPSREDNKEISFQGAVRDSAEAGVYENIGRFDLSSAYPSMITNFCLDPQNIIPKQEVCSCGNGSISSGSTCIKCGKLAREDALAYVNGNYVGQTIVNNIIFKQNSNALLPIVVRKLLVLKDRIKQLKKENPNNKTIEIKYDAIKGTVNSAFGVIGLPYFRLFHIDVASSITFLVRDLLMYVKERIEFSGLRVIYYDTDSVYINQKEDISDKLNEFISDWAAEKFNKTNLNLSFEYQGYFTRVFFLSRCHYYGYVQGKSKPEIKGIEVKRSSSSLYEAKMQENLLEKVLNKQTFKEINSWINSEYERIKTLPIEEIGFPAKIASKEYKNTPIFKRAYENTRKIKKDFKLNRGDLFYYIFMKNYGSDVDVLAFTKDNKSFIKENEIDWNRTIDRAINYKTRKIYDALGWSLLHPNQTTLF